MTVVILTLNEERNIAACVESVKGASTILVVDAGSTDRTMAVAASVGATVVSHAMTSFADQRNHATTLADSEWVFHLDADERVTPELWREISSVTSNGACDGYLVPRVNVIFGAPVRHGGWYPQYHLRLYRRSKGTWSGIVHEAAHVSGAVGRLREPRMHFGHGDLTTFLQKIDRYTTMEARQLGRPVLLLGLMAILLPAPYFIYKYVFQLGFLDGWRGLAVAALLSFYRCVTYLKAIERTARSTEARRLTR